jgi:CRP-like cAMP-binding protein/tRNA A-37 threonylcarbamoyl transferase component Bud32
LTKEDLAWIMQNRFFDGIADESKKGLFSEMTKHKVRAGERFIRQGDVGGVFYIIRSGECVVSLERNGRTEIVGRLGPGEIVGEMAVLTGEPRNANVEAATDSVLWGIAWQAFERACELHPDLREFLTNVLYTRFARALVRRDLVIGKYFVTRVLGRGGSGIVYLGAHTTLGMPVAVKMLRHNMAVDPSFVEEFRNEAIAIAHLNHENIVKVYDVEELFRTFFIVMEYVEGRTLEYILRREEKRPLPQLLDIFLQVCAGLRHAHEKGIIHRDVKPGNILVQEDNRAKIVDFGLACATGTRSAKAKGSPFFASPEQIKGKHMDERSDIYSLGITAYEMFTGKKPFGGSSMKEILKQALSGETRDPRKVVPDLPEELSAFIINATRLNPLERPETIARVLYELEPLARRLGLTTQLRDAEPLNMMSLYLFYRDGQSPMMKKLVKEFSRELQKVGARLRMAGFSDIRE